MRFAASPCLVMDPIKELLAQDSLAKHLSALHFSLLSIDSPKMERLWEQWRADLPDLNREGIGRHVSRTVLDY